MKKQVLLALLIGIAGIAIGYFIKPSKNETKISGEAQEQAKTIWTCSMHPQIEQDKPGKCPICGMDLVPKDQVKNSGDAEKEHYRLAMSTTALALADIQTTQVLRGVIPSEDNSKFILGRIAIDNQRGTAQLSAHIPGRIEKLFIKTEGQKIKKGQKIAVVYSPELIQAQQELIEATKFNNKQLLESVKQKFYNWKFSEKQIENIIKTKKVQTLFSIYADHSGTVQTINVQTGDYIKTGTYLAELYNTNSLLAEFEIYESDFAKIKPGQKIHFFISSLPEKKFSGTIKYIEPSVNKDNVLIATAEIQNKSSLLKPGILLKGYIVQTAKKYKDKLLIPRSAVLWTGKKSVVYVKIDSEVPSFEYREVILGETVGDYYVVLEGLKEGEEVVTSGEFFIDSAMQLTNRASMLNKLTLNAKAEKKYQVSQKVKHHIHQLLKPYFELRDAFVASNSINAQKSASQMLKILAKGVNFENTEAEKFWNTQKEILEKYLKEISSSSDLHKQRLAFANVSNAMIAVVKAFSVKMGNLYITYCPMFIKDEKAYWISDTKQIKNPYFGEKMLNCGSVEDSL